MFGMIQPDPTSRPGDGPGLYQRRLPRPAVSFSETDDGRYLITLSG